MSKPDDRDYPSGESNDARLKRWLVDHETDPAIREPGELKALQMVTMTGGSLYEMLFEVVEWAYWKGVNDVRGRHGA